MTGHAAIESTEHTESSRGRWGVLVAAVLVLVLFRLHAFGLPLETDECNYAYIGGRLVEGDRLYVDVWDHQPPGVFVLFAGVMATLGQSDAVFRWVAIAFSVASLALVYHIARREFGAFPAAVGALVFAVTSSDPGIAGEGCNREIYMNTCALAALALLLSSARSRGRIVAAGLCLGVGSAFKTVIAAQWLLFAVWVAGRCYCRDRSARRAAMAVFCFGVGPAVVWCGVSAYFAMSGRWWAFVDAVFTYNLGYSGGGEGGPGRLIAFFDPVFQVFNSAQPLWNAALVSGVGLIVLARRRLGGVSGAVVAYLIGSYLAVCLPGRFWPHYYYLLLAPAILACAAVLALLLDGGGTRRALGLRCGGVAWVAVLLLCQLVHYGLLAPSEITAPHRSYRYRQAWSRAQGLRVGAVTDPGDTVFVWGNDAGIYYYANRVCASRFTMVGALMDDASGAGERRETLLGELAERRPRVVLIVEPEFAELEAFLQSRYLMAGPRAVDRHDDRPEKIVMVALADRDQPPVRHIDWEWRWRE